MAQEVYLKLIVQDGDVDTTTKKLQTLGHEVENVDKKSKKAGGSLNDSFKGAGESPRVTLKGFSYSRVTETTYEVFRKNIDTSVDNSLFVNFDVPLVFTGREVIYFTASTDVNNTEVSGRFTGILVDS